MRFPDRVTYLRPAGTDAYGNPGEGWAAPKETPDVSAFLVETSGRALFPAGTGSQEGDRFRMADGRLFSITRAVSARSPARTVAEIADVVELPEGG